MKAFIFFISILLLCTNLFSQTRLPMSNDQLSMLDLDTTFINEWRKDISSCGYRRTSYVRISDNKKLIGIDQDLLFKLFGKMKRNTDEIYVCTIYSTCDHGAKDYVGLELAFLFKKKKLQQVEVVIVN
ncbi:MAG: hypothetical protein QM737_18820 [Ferruginibacter sp.]